MKRLSLTEHQWKTIVAQWKKSGESMSAYSKTKGISKSSLSYWVRKFRREKTVVPSGFIKIPVSNECSVAAKTCEILFPNGARIMFYKKPDYRKLKQLFL